MSDEIRILVVDDEPTQRSLLTDVLSDCGYEVCAVSSGEEALERLKEIHFEVVMTDLRMPGMSGMELIREAKLISPDSRIIVITGYGTPEIEIESFQLGACDYISKPFNLEQIRASVKRALEIGMANAG